MRRFSNNGGIQKRRRFGNKSKTRFDRSNDRSNDILQSIVPFTENVPIPEIKVVDYSNQYFPLQFDSVFGDIRLINAINNGTAFYERIGNRIAMKSLHLTGFIERNVSNTMASNEDYLRVMIVYDRQPNGALPVITDILQDVDAVGNTYNFGLSGINMDNRNRFKMIIDERIHVPPLGINGANPAYTGYSPDINYSNNGGFKINRFIKLNNLVTHYNPTFFGDEQDITTGTLMIIGMCYNNTLADDSVGWQFTFTCRLKYSDV